MVKIKKAGYRRLYESTGCDIGGAEELSTTVTLDGGISVDIYIGKKPRYGITTYKAPRYLTIGAKIELANFSHTAEPEGDKAGLLYTEIFCWRRLEVSDEIGKGLENNNPQARETVLSFAGKNQAALKSAADIVAGMLGLRFHRQFVLQKCDENSVAVPENSPHVFSMVSPAVEILEAVRVHPEGGERIKNFLNSIAAVEKKHHKWASAALFFLMKAWAESDPISKFMALFIPFELILQDVSIDTENPHIQSIRKIVQEHGGEQNKELLTYVDHLARANRPSLNARFGHLAQQANLEGWEQDVIAVKKFNAMRNALLHQGESRVALMVAISEGSDKAAQLEDIVERYLSFRIFGDGLVYPSIYRKRSLPKVADII